MVSLLSISTRLISRSDDITDKDPERTHTFYLPARDKRNQILQADMVESNTIRLYHTPSDSVSDPVAGGFASRGDFAAMCYCDGPSTGADIGQCFKNPDQTLDVKCVFPDPRTYGGGCAYFWARWGGDW